MKKWIDYKIKERTALLHRAEENIQIHINAIEKDWWVTIILKALFQCNCKDYLSFKGGTSLSKGWNLIERFSEDIDLSIYHDYFGEFGKTKNQREKLRRIARTYVITELAQELDEQLKNLGVKDYVIEPVLEQQGTDGVITNVDSDKDPSVILVKYKSILNSTVNYITPHVKIEISCLSMREPTADIHLSSLIEQTMNGTDDGSNCTIRTVVPTRTFLEKAFLLNEEFQKATPRYERMSRHLYDLEQLMDTEFGENALNDSQLYKDIVKHRATYNKLGYVDYNKHHPKLINFIPSTEIIEKWENDYNEMQKHFIYGNSLDFNSLIQRIEILQNRFRSIEINELDLTD